MQSSSTALAIVVSALLIAACGGGTSTQPAQVVATKLAFAFPPRTVASGAVISPSVQVAVEDAEGNVVTSSTARITLGITSGSGTAGGVLRGTLTRTAINGIATFNDLTIDKAGPDYSLTATANSLASASTGAFVVTPGSAFKLAITAQPSTTISGAAISPVVQATVLDAQGNIVTTSTASITMAMTNNGPAGAVLGGTHTRSAIGGVATFDDLRIEKAGTGYRMMATASGLMSATSTTFAVLPGPASTLALTVPFSSAIGGVATLPVIEVRVQDAHGNNVTGTPTSITLAITSGSGAAGATLSGTLTRPAINGTASFNDLKIDKVGTGYRLTAMTPGLQNGSSGEFSVVVHKDMAIEPYLATPIDGAIWTVPVTVLAYLPTADGVNIDVRKSPDHWVLGPISLTAVEGHILDIARRKKMSIEQGSRYRGYSNPAALPSIGIRVVRIRFVYDIVPASSVFKVPDGAALPDYTRIVPEQGLDVLINSGGVRQVWLTLSSFGTGSPSYDPAIHSLADIRALDESNMSSSLTGDISNSWRFEDLPILAHPYIVYGINWRRSQAEAVHNVGHQLEAQYSYIAQRQDGSSRLFWRDFVGQNANDQFITGRAGWTHMPPNTVGNYDYLNPIVVESDIQDWRPDNAGTKSGVSVSTWASHVHPWPGAAEFSQRTESQWYIYWFQSMPGRGNTIPYGGSWMTNWWAFTGDWHAAVNSTLGLHAVTPAAVSGTGSAALVRVVDPDEANREAARWPVMEPRFPRQ